MPKPIRTQEQKKVECGAIVPGLRLDSYGNIRVTFDVEANSLSLREAKQQAIKYR